MILLVLALVATGCGISEDEAPAPVSLDDLPASLRPGALNEPVPIEPGEGATQPIYMVGPNNRLEVVLRDVPAQPDAVLSSLLNNVTELERVDGVGSALTRATTIIGNVDVNPLFQLATVTLGPDSLDEQVQEQLLGYGQIVFTLTEIEGIESVAFQIRRGSNTQPIQIRTDLGLTDPGESVQRADYASIDPGRPVVVPTFPDDDALPTATPVVVESSSGLAFDLPIWVVDEDAQLVRVQRRSVLAPGALLQSLLDGVLTPEAGAGLRSAINPDALANRVEVLQIVDELGSIRGLAVVDLSEASLPATPSPERVLATGQIVFTLTELAEIDQVLFTIDGVPSPMETQNGFTAAFDPSQPTGGLTRADFSELADTTRIIERPSVTPTPEPTPQPTTQPTPEPAPTP